MYVHNMDPYAFKIGDFFGLRWYGLAYLAGLFLGYGLVHYLAKKRAIHLKVEQVSDFVTTIALGVMIGGRLGYCIFYAPELLTHIGSEFPFWGVLEINRGGMASHGGIAGLIGAAIYFSRKHKISVFELLDLTTFGGSIGIFLGRIANFINGELFGRVASEGFAWAVKFPQEIYLWVNEQFDPVKLRALGPAVEEATRTLANPIREGQWIDMVGQAEQHRTGANFGLFRHQLYGGIEAVSNLLDQHNEKILNLVAPTLSPRYPSQLFEAALEGLLVFVILAWVWRKPRKPGTVALFFGYTYVFARVVGEQFRMPDPQIGFQLFDLTRGQWLSIAMLGVCFVYQWFLRRSEDDYLVGGWKNTFARESK